VKSILFILSLLLFTCSHAQIKEEIIEHPDSSESIIKVMPPDWDNASGLELAILNEHNKKVYDKSLPDLPTLNRTMIDISNLKTGTYTIQVILNEKGYSVNKVSSAFIKTACIRSVGYILTRQISQSNRPPSHGHGVSVFKEPVVYLYPKQTENISVKVDLKGTFLQTIPAYNGGWNVTAKPNGSLVNRTDGKQYPYLFWEGESSMKTWNMDSGFVVKGVDAEKFLDTILPQMGLNTQEKQDFITYWLPQLQKNRYNLIHFIGREYEQIARLDVSPKPDAELVLIMAFKKADCGTNVKTQPIKTFTRKGFTVVEWGGTELDEPARYAGNY
jgi:hypothetical protein